MVYSNLARVFEQEGVTANFKLIDGTEFTLNVVRGHKRDDDLTDGLLQGTFKVRVLAPQWDAEHASAPSKGDQLTMVTAGTRHAVERAHPVNLSNRPLMYVLIMKG